MNTPTCNYNILDGKESVLVSKKRCLIGKTGIFVKKGCSRKNAIIRLRTNTAPNEINTKLYQCLFVDKSDLDKSNIPYYD